MKRGKLFSAVMVTVALWPASATAQAVIVPSPVPACADANALIWQASSSTFICGTPTSAVADGSITNAKVSASAAIAYSKLNLAGSIVNADVATGAAIAYSKLALTGAVLNADLAGSIAYAKLTLTGAIVNADVSASAAIAYSKLNLAASLVNADVASGAAIAYSKLALTGAVLNADLAGSIAASKLVGSDIATVGTITTGVWNAGAVTSSGAVTGTSHVSTQGTITADAQAVSTTATWNNAAVTFVQWKANVTDTASAAASLLADLQVGGASKFKVNKTGDLSLARAMAIDGATASTAGIKFAAAGATPASTANALYSPDGASLYFNGTLLATGAAATTIAVTDDTTTNATMYPTWVTGASGDRAIKVSSTKVTFNPSTGTLTSTTFSGALAASNLTGTVAPANGGAGADVSGIAKGGLVVGTAAGTFGIKAVGTNGYVLTADSAETGGVKWAAAAAGGTANKDIVNGRLTLETGVAVSTTNQAAKTTLYFTTYSGNQIGLYDGTSTWTVLTFSELSLSLAGYTASKLYDIWVYNNSGTAALESTVWTSATARATALVAQDGVLVKTGATTRRYVGTIYINSSGGQTDDTFSKANVWNFYNRVERALKVTEATASWTYSTNAWRQANNATANQFEVTVGVAGDALEISATGMATSTTANDKSFTGIGIDDSTNNSATTYGPVLVDSATALPGRALYMDVTQLGYRTYRWLELPNAITGTMTWAGTNGAGMIGRVAR